MIHVVIKRKKINNYDHVAYTLAYLFIHFIIHLNPLMRHVINIMYYKMNEE